jgi:hypothetical protein
MGDFTLEQKRDYIASRGAHCPGCRSGNLVGGDVTVTDGVVYQEVRCHGCDITFTDVYHLASVETEEYTGPGARVGSGQVTAKWTTASASEAAATRPLVQGEAQQT